MILPHIRWWRQSGEPGSKIMAPLHVATLTVQRELPQYELVSRSLPYLCTKNETKAPLHVATLTVQRELPKYEIIFSI